MMWGEEDGGLLALTEGIERSLGLIYAMVEMDIWDGVYMKALGRAGMLDWLGMVL